MGMYRNHKKATFGINDENLEGCQDRVTFLSFDQWLTFYNADPAHWTDLVNSNYESGRREYHLPVYTTEKAHTSPYTQREIIEHKYHYIKFLTRRDFWKYIRFMRKAEKKGEDYQNSQEILVLAEAVRKESAKRVEALQKEQAEAVRRNQEIIDNMDSAADLINFMIRGEQAR